MIEVKIAAITVVAVQNAQNSQQEKEKQDLNGFQFQRMRSERKILQAHYNLMSVSKKQKQE